MVSSEAKVYVPGKSHSDILAQWVFERQFLRLSNFPCFVYTELMFWEGGMRG